MALGDIYIRASRFSDAEAQFVAVLEKNPNAVVAENNLAWVLLQQGKATEALTRARHAASLAPNAAAVLDTLGVVLLQSGKGDEAVDTLRRARTAAAEGDPSIPFHLAQALVAVGKKDEARTILQAILQTDRPFEGRDQAQTLLAQLGG